MDNGKGGVKTRQQMAVEYGVCRKTFNKLLLSRDIRLGKGVISPKDQQLIYHRLGYPNNR